MINQPPVVTSHTLNRAIMDAENRFATTQRAPLRKVFSGERIRFTGIRARLRYSRRRHLSRANANLVRVSYCLAAFSYRFYFRGFATVRLGNVYTRPIFETFRPHVKYTIFGTKDYNKKKKDATIIQKRRFVVLSPRHI